MRKIWLTLVALTLIAAACSGDDSSGEGATTTLDDPTPTTQGIDGSEVGACPLESQVEIANSDTADGEVEVAMAIADGGPHPTNTVESDDQNAQLAIASYEIPEDPQFGLGIPIGEPDAPDGEVILIVSLFSETEIAPGVFVDQLADDPPAGAQGEINFIALYQGADRIGPLGETTVTITEVNDDFICGEIAAIGETELQVLATFTGEFVAERLQSLD